MSEQHWIDEHRDAIRHFSLVPGVPPACIVAGCTRTPVVHNLCKPHYRRARRAFDPSYPRERS